MARLTGADADTLWLIEGAATYGALVVCTVATHGFAIAEAQRMDAKKNRGVDKSDTLDAHRMTAAAAPSPV